MAKFIIIIDDVVSWLFCEPMIFDLLPFESDKAAFGRVAALEYLARREAAYFRRLISALGTVAAFDWVQLLQRPVAGSEKRRAWTAKRDKRYRRVVGRDGRPVIVATLFVLVGTKQGVQEALVQNGGCRCRRHGVHFSSVVQNHLHGAAVDMFATPFFHGANQALTNIGLHNGVALVMTRRDHVFSQSGVSTAKNDQQRERLLLVVVAVRCCILLCTNVADAQQSFLQGRGDDDGRVAAAVLLDVCCFLPSLLL